MSHLFVFLEKVHPKHKYKYKYKYFLDHRLSRQFKLLLCARQKWFSCWFQHFLVENFIKYLIRFVNHKNVFKLLKKSKNILAIEGHQKLK